ncbi:MAG: 16S rRNA (cytosine(1402)-N(4))-methyltransferase RsmH [Verrucomicrobia bacterium]|nr:16S rRNA (cytosine(1402)-N(4))-methyltransferase RsmH [Verrucomicrobiota bacterium]
MHTTVLLNEAVDGLNINPKGTYLDGTLGRAGHSEAILARLDGEGLLIGIDQDQQAIETAGTRLEATGKKFRLFHGNFGEMTKIARKAGIDRFDGIILDLGVSSDQLDDAERGFSFQKEGPLDMRMNREQDITAEKLVSSLPEADIAEILWKYGEEKASRRIAKAIVRVRANSPITTTLQLADLVNDVKGGRRGRTHPATKTFQALRIAVNRELECVEEGVEQGLSLLKPGGRMSVITFHSLEDRIVKRRFNAHAGRMESLAAGGERWDGTEPRVRKITRKPVRPSEREIDANPRARSAKLRVVERY